MSGYWERVAETFAEVSGGTFDPVALACASGDHRRCEACAHALRWHGSILRAAQDALARTPTRRLAVLCIHAECVEDGQPRMLATVADSWTAAGLRNSHAKRVHDLYSEPDGGVIMKSLVPVVDSQPILRLR